MEIQVKINKKLMSRETEDGPRKEIINHVISYPDHRGRIRHNTEDEIREIAANLQEVIKEIDAWHEINSKKEEVN